MAILTATAASSIAPFRSVHSGLFSITGGPFSFVPSAGDVVQMVKVPSGFKVKEILAMLADRPLSAGGTVQSILTIGDGLVPGRFASVSASITALFRLGVGVVTTALNYQYTADDTIDITVGAATGTDSASHTMTFTLVAMGSVDD